MAHPPGITGFIEGQAFSWKGGIVKTQICSETPRSRQNGLFSLSCQTMGNALAVAVQTWMAKKILDKGVLTLS